jgi:hypothetical protein
MIKSRIVCAAVLSALAIVTASAADRPSNWPTFIGAAPPPESPYYVIDQGPELSGPGIMIVEIRFTNTDMKRAYPFIGTSDDLTRVVVPATDFFGAAPAATVRRKIRSRHSARPTAVRRMPTKAPVTLNPAE